MATNKLQTSHRRQEREAQEKKIIVTKKKEDENGNICDEEEELEYIYNEDEEEGAESSNKNKSNIPKKVVIISKSRQKSKATSQRSKTITPRSPSIHNTPDGSVHVSTKTSPRVEVEKPAPSKKEPVQAKKEQDTMLSMFDNANPEELQYMEQYGVGGNTYATAISAPSVTPVKPTKPSRLAPSPKAPFSFERMLVLDLVSESKAPQQIVITPPAGQGGSLTKEQQDDIIKKVAAVTENQKINQIEIALNPTRNQVTDVQSRVNSLPSDLSKKFSDLQATVRRWVENCAILHKKVTELSDGEYAASQKASKRITFATFAETKNGTISIPPAKPVVVPISDPAKSSSSAVTKPEIVIEMKSQPKLPTTKDMKPKDNMFVFTSIEMVNSPPKSNAISRNSTKEELDIRAEDFQIAQDAFKEQVEQASNNVEGLKFTISRLENDLFQVAHEFEEFKAQVTNAPPKVQTVENYYVNGVETTKDEALDALEKLKAKDAATENDKEQANKDNQQAEAKQDEKPGEQSGNTEAKDDKKPPQKSPSMEERLEEAEKEMQDPMRSQKNVLLWEMQCCTAFYVDTSGPDTKEQGKTAEIDTETIAIPRYDEQFRIMRDALVDMRTNQQILKQRTEEKFAQVIQKQMSMATADKLLDSSQLNQFKKGIDSKLVEYESEFSNLRQELYQFMKDRPERIIERVKEVVVEKPEEAKPEKKKKKPKKKQEEAPPPPPPPEIDIDLQIKKKKKLIGEIESPRIFDVRPMDLQTKEIESDSGSEDTPIIDSSESKPSFPQKMARSRKRLPIIDSDYDDSEDDVPVNNKLSDGEEATKSTVLPSDTPSRADE